MYIILTFNYFYIGNVIKNMGISTSHDILSKHTISFTAIPSITSNNSKYPIKNSIFKKIKTRGLKTFFTYASKGGSSYKSIISHYINFTPINVIYKNNVFYVKGTILLTKNKKKLQYMPTNLSTINNYKKFIKIQIPHASKSGDPIQTIDKKYHVWIDRIEDIDIV